jgi:hypothetical protein
MKKFTPTQLSRILSEHAAGALRDLFGYSEEHFAWGDYTYWLPGYRRTWTADRVLRALEKAGLA